MHSFAHSNIKLYRSCDLLHPFAFYNTQINNLTQREYSIQLISDVMQSVVDP